MQRQLSEEELSRYRAELATLPIGSISRKTIAGKVRYYRSSPPISERSPAS